MNRSLWTQTLTEFYCPPLPCPTCGKGVFSLVPKSLVYQDTANSRFARLDEDSSFHDITYRFTARLKCGHSFCGDEAVLVGLGGVEEQQTEEGWEETKYFSPKFCLPMPDLISIPQKCPPPVASELRAGFALYWSDPAAAANCLRAAVERIMDHFRIPRRQKNTKRKLYELHLHKRLELFKNAYEETAKRLIAVKWFGNTGSHERNISRDEVLDALDLLEDSLIELFEQRSRRLTGLTRNLMKKHAPQRSKKTKNP